MLNFKKGLRLVSPSHIFFQEKCFSCYFLLTDQIHCLIAFTSRDIGLYVFYNCFLTRLWRHKIWNKPYLFNQALLIHDQKVKPKTSISWKRKELLRWNKNHFSSLLKGFSCQKLSQTWDCAFNNTETERRLVLPLLTWNIYYTLFDS